MLILYTSVFSTVTEIQSEDIDFSHDHVLLDAVLREFLHHNRDFWNAETVSQNSFNSLIISGI